MSETDWSQASKPIPPFRVHPSDAAVNAANAEEPKTKLLKGKAVQAKAWGKRASETKAIEAGTLETVRSLSQQALTMTLDIDHLDIDHSDQPVSAQQTAQQSPQQTLISPTSERFSDALEKRDTTAAVTETSAQPLTIEPPETLEPTPQSSQAPPLYFLVVNYHNAALISDLLHTLEANQGIVLVNNSPVDRVIHGLAGQTYANGTVTVLDAPENVGFSTACNLGLEWIYARSPNALVWLIKSDAQLVPRAVASVRQCFTQRPDLAILGTPILNASGKPWFAAGQFNPWLGVITSQRLGKADVLGRPIPTRWVSSGSMIFNFAVLGHCPQFDETYFLYYEDCDLCERYFQQGAAIALTPSPLIIRSGTTGLSRYTYPRHANAAFSRLTFLSRHGTPIALGLNLLVLWGKALLFKVSDRTAAQGCWQGIQRFLNLPRR